MTDTEKSYARLFASHDGAVVLKHLRAITIERILGPDASDAQLRTLEGQRAIVRQIESMISRGRAPHET